MDELAGMIGGVSTVLVLGWIVKLSLAHARTVKLTRLQYELQSKLLDKFTTSQDLAEYLRGDAGVGFLRSAMVERSSPYSRILGSVQVGLILLTGGAAFLMLEGRIAEADEAFAFMGTLGVALGVGFCLSAAVAYILSKVWGLINGSGSAGRLPESS
jgi:hypothetical protein